VVDLNNITNITEETITIDIVPYYGLPQVYCHYNTLPSQLSQYQWSMTEYGFSKISIRAG
jgi:hypothetical protein